ncbi:MAG: PDZ domain-containing protein, partial [Planctomycetia bacterium]
AGSGWLGFSVDDALVTGRLVVVEVAPDGPGARAGMRPRDVLLSLNGTQLHTSDELAATLAALAPGQQVKMVVGRDTRLEELVAEATTRPAAAAIRPWQASATAEPAVIPPAAMVPAAAVPPLAAAPAIVPPSVGPGIVAAVEPPARARPSAPLPFPSQPLAVPAVSSPSSVAAPSILQPATPQQGTGRTALGVRTVPVDSSVQNRFHLTERSGAFVIGVVQDLPAAKAGVPPGSVIVSINHQPVRSPQDLTQLVTRGPVGTPVPLEYVLPGGAAKHADVVLQSLELPLERALVGDEPAAAAPAEQAPRVTRRVQGADGTGSQSQQRPLERLEDVLRRMNAMNARLERIESRLDELAPPR